MGQLALLATVASLSLAVSALLALGGLPERLPIAAAAAASAAICATICAVCRRRGKDEAPPVARPGEPAVETSGAERELAAAR